MYDATGPKLDQQVQQAAQRQNPEVRLHFINVAVQVFLSC